MTPESLPCDHATATGLCAEIIAARPPPG